MFLKQSVTMVQQIQWAAREKVVAKGVASGITEKLNAFTMWRLLCRGQKSDTATRKVGLLERVVEDQDASGWILVIGSSGRILLANVKKHLVA